MNLESILHLGLAKEGKVSLPYALQISSFLFFTDQVIRGTDLKPISAWKFTPGDLAPLTLLVAFLLVLFGILDRVVPIFLLILITLKSMVWTRKQTTRTAAKEYVSDFKFEWFALETNNGVAFHFLNREKEERERYIRNGGVFLLWIWLCWSEMTFCIPVSGTMGHLVLPIPVSPLVITAGLLVCLVVTGLWILALEQTDDSRIRVSKKLYKEVQGREDWE